VWLLSRTAKIAGVRKILSTRRVESVAVINMLNRKVCDIGRQ
jgi:hypothetical protein